MKGLRLDQALHVLSLQNPCRAASLSNYSYSLEKLKIIADSNFLLKFTPIKVTKSVLSDFKKPLEHRAFFGVTEMGRWQTEKPSGIFSKLSFQNYHFPAPCVTTSSSVPFSIRSAINTVTCSGPRCPYYSLQ